VALAHAAPLFDSVQLISDSAVALDPVPPAQTFTLTQAGDYSVTLTDLQLPAALSSLSLALVTPTQNVLSLAAAGTQSVSLVAGTYTVQVLALAATGAVGGAFGVQVTPAGSSTPVWQYSDAVGAAAPPPSTGQSILSTKLTVAGAGSYTLTVTDLAFPVALSSLTLVLLNDCGTTPGCTTAPVSPTPIAGPNISTPLTLSAGTYDLFVVANAASPALQGLYGIELVPTGGGAAIYTAAVPVGELPTPITLNFKSAGAASVQLADLHVPAALSTLSAVITQSGSVLVSTQASGTASFIAAAGAAQLYVIGQPSGMQGALEAVVTAGGATVADVALPELQGGAFGFGFATDLAAAGSYQLSVHDFQLPTAFSSLAAIAAQGGTVLTDTTGTGSFNAAAGPLNVLVFPALTGAPTANGLFSVQVNAASNGASALQTTQGVGALFSSQTLQVTQAGSYDFELTDLGFPANFGTLGLIVTRADTFAGQVYDNGKVSAALQPGDYVLNVLSQVGIGVDYGLYGIQVEATPAAPTVTLTASPNSVTTGQSTTLTWSSTGATSCSASGAWSGTLATSGSQASGALSTTTTFTLTCTGSGGTAMASATVTVTPAPASSGGKGGGSLRGDELVALLGLWLLRRIRSPRRSTV
jgi:hypothetical protein